MMHKRGITLIELMVVIIVLGILSLIALPNIKNIKSKAALSVAMENKNTVQKGVDKYFLEKQELPTTSVPTKEVPVQIDWSKLVPPYIRSKPADLDKIYYWIDYNNTVWVSDVDAPQGLVLNADGKSVSWSSVSGATGYKIGYIEETANKINGKIVAGKSYKEMASITRTSYTSSIDLTGKTVVVSAVSNNFESVPVGIGYTGNTLQSGSGEAAINHKPVAIITMTPEETITTSTTITWGYENSTDEDGDQITDAEWDGKQDTYTTTGTYTVKLRVQDSKNNWSDWAEKSFNVEKAGIQSVVPVGWIAINSISDLSKIGTDAGYSLSGNYILMHNLDFAETSYATGYGWAPIMNFTGQFDGNGLTINNLMINRPSTNDIGLFGRATSPVINNLILNNVNIKGYNNVGAVIGCGITQPKLSRIKITGSVSGVSNIGGLIGGYQQNYSFSPPTIDQCIVNGTIIGSCNRIGGWIGGAGASIISNSYVMGTVQGPNDTTPTVGYNSYGKTIIKYSYVKVDYKWQGWSKNGGTNNTYVFGNSFETTTEICNVSNTLAKVYMMKKLYYTDYNFSTIWTIQEDIDYPRLMWENR